MALQPFQIDVAPGTGVRLLSVAIQFCAIAGLLLCAWLVWSTETEGAGWLLGFGLLMLGIGWRHARRATLQGRLKVDDEGQAYWLAPVHETSNGRMAHATTADISMGDGSALHGAAAISIDRWRAGHWLVWIRTRDGQGRTRDLLLTRDATPADSWHRLAVWLSWLGRGGAHEAAGRTVQPAAAPGAKRAVP